MSDNVEIEVIPTPRRGRPPLVSEAMFVEVWNAADSLEEVAMVLFPEGPLDERKLYCSMRAAAIRKNAPDLKKFPRGRKATPQVVVEEETEAVTEVAAE